MPFRISIQPELPFAFGDDEIHAVKQELRKQRVTRRWDSIENLYDGKPKSKNDLSRTLRSRDIVNTKLWDHVFDPREVVNNTAWVRKLLKCRGGAVSEEALECLEDFAGKHARSRFEIPRNRRSWTSGDEGQELDAPYHMLATLRLDGKKEYEKQSIIYLDRDHQDFKFPHGITRMASRKIRGEDGVLRECAWYVEQILHFRIRNTCSNGD